MADLENQTSPEAKKQLPLGEGEAETVEEGAGKEKVEGEEAEPQKPSEPRTYTEEEYRKFQSAKDREVSTLAKQLEKASRRLDELQAQYDTMSAQAEEQSIASWLKSVEEGGGDVDLARQVATKRKELVSAEREQSNQRRQLAEQSAKVDEALKLLSANELVEKYDLGKEAVEKLIESKDPMEMKAIALELALGKAKAEKTPAKKVASGAGASTKGQDLSKMSIKERIVWALENEQRR